MRRKCYIVMGDCPNYKPEHKERHEDEKPSSHVNTHAKSEVANKIYDDPDFDNYIKRYGMHFTDELAERAISLLVPVGDKNKTKWPVAKVIEVIKSHGIKVRPDTTPGDLAYQANLYYMTLYSDMIKTELDCIRAAAATDMDPNAYAGNIFNRWVADMMAKVNVKIDWKKYV